MHICTFGKTKIMKKHSGCKLETCQQQCLNLVCPETSSDFSSFSLSIKTLSYDYLVYRGSTRFFQSALLLLVSQLI